MPKLELSQYRRPLFVIVSIALVMIAGLYLYQQFITLPDDSNFRIIANQKSPGIITSVGVAKTIDLTSSSPLVTASSFGRQEKNIYLVLGINNAPIGTRIAYIRFLNGKQIDQKSVTISKTGQKYLSFNWALKDSGSLRMVGRYRVKVYTNGIFEKDVIYDIIP